MKVIHLDGLSGISAQLQRFRLVSVVCVWGALAFLAPAARAGDWDFNSQADLTKDKIQKFLSRAVTHFDTASFNSFGAAELERTRQFLLHTGAKFVHGAELSWGRAYPDHTYWDRCRTAIASLHATPGLEDVIFEGFLAEHISSDADVTLIPDWLWNYMEAEGINATRTPSPNDAGGRHYFHYDNFFGPGWAYKDRWAPGQSVPDLTKTETKLYYRYLLKEHIEAGFESIWFGQLGLTGALDSNSVALNELRQFARAEALQNGYRHAILLTSHVTGRSHNGEQMLDYICFPCRMRYSDRYPHGLIIDGGLPDESVRDLVRFLQNEADLPALLEIDNYDCTPAPPIGRFGFDEITGFAYKEPWQRRAFLEQYYWEVRTYYNGWCNNRVFLAMPGRRCICLPGCSGQLNTNPDVPYPSAWYSPYTEHCGDEDTIATLFSSPTPTHLGPRNTISVDLGDTDVEDGLVRVPVYDGDTAPQDLGGRNCRGPLNPPSDPYIYFNVNDGYACNGFHRNLFIVIDYYDGSGGPLSLQYDADNGNPYKNAESISLTGSGTWRQQRFHVTDAWFGNRENNGADFRIANFSGQMFYLDKITITLAPEISLTATAFSRVFDRGRPNPSDSFKITNSGSSCRALNYTVTANAGWVSTDTSQGSLKPGEQSASIQIRYNLDSLPLGLHAAEIRVEDPAAIDARQVIPIRVVVRQRGDQDFDADVDQEDFGLFQACLSGEGVHRSEVCALADLDLDEDVDQFDFALFLPCWTGPNEPASPGCGT